MTRSWSECALGDVITLQRGFDITQKEQRPGRYPVISSSGPVSTHDQFKVDGPGVVIGRKGSLGGVYYSEGAYWPHDTTLWVKDFHGNNPLFVYYWLQTLGLEHYDVGASNPTLNRNHLHVLPVRVPDVTTQQVIAGVLSFCDQLIENNTARIRILEQMVQLIYREWFIEFRYPGHEGVPLVHSDLGPIPEGWKCTCLADHVELRRTNVAPEDTPDETFDHYSIPAFDVAGMPVTAPGIEIKSGKYALERACVLLSKLNPRFPRVWRVDPSVSTRRAVCSTEFLVLVATGDWPLPFAYSVVSDPNFGARLVSLAGGTSTSHQRARPNDVMALPIFEPPSQLVSKFSDRVGPILALADNLTNQRVVLRDSRDLLLPRLVSGDIDVAALNLSEVA
jgi:type I restriction enzyme, S subunit